MGFRDLSNGGRYVYAQINQMGDKVEYGVVWRLWEPLNNLMVCHYFLRHWWWVPHIFRRNHLLKHYVSSRLSSFAEGLVFIAFRIFNGRCGVAMRFHLSLGEMTMIFVVWCGCLHQPVSSPPCALRLTDIEPRAVYEYMIWRFPKIGGTPNHPKLD